MLPPCLYAVIFLVPRVADIASYTLQNTHGMLLAYADGALLYYAVSSFRFAMRCRHFEFRVILRRATLLPPPIHAAAATLSPAATL